MPNNILENIRRRFLIFKGEIYPIQTNDLDGYGNRFSSLQTKQEDFFPWWFSVSSWLVESKVIQKQNNKFVDDILWAQFCIFLSVRILDDIYDKQAKNSNLVFIPLLLQLEADRQFAKYFPKDSTFWKRKNEFQQKTLISIILVNKLQRNRKTDLKDLLQAYANVAAIFKIGITAIYELEKDIKRLRLFYRFADELAIISQLFDDFYDIPEDLKLDKINSAVRIILDNISTGIIDGLTDKVAQALQYKDGFNNLAVEIRKHIKIASGIAQQLKIQEALFHVQSFEKALKSLEMKQHKKRVEFFFGHST